MEVELVASINFFETVLHGLHLKSVRLKPISPTYKGLQDPDLANPKSLI